MQTFEATIVCAEPVANGFSCDADDTVVFSYIGDVLTHERVRTVTNEQTNKKCWKCGMKNWRIKGLFPFGFRHNVAAVRV